VGAARECYGRQQIECLEPVGVVRTRQHGFSLHRGLVHVEDGLLHRHHIQRRLLLPTEVVGDRVQRVRGGTAE